MVLRVIGGVSGGFTGQKQIVETSACDRDRDPIFSDLIDYPDHY